MGATNPILAGSAVWLVRLYTGINLILIATATAARNLGTIRE
jgi:hypothetical protein